MADYSYIDRQHKLDLALNQLESSPFLAVDTESSSFYTYYSELCLIQVSGSTGHFIIDPLAEIDLTNLQKFFEGPAVIIFHSALSDMTELYRDFGWRFVNIFDTMHACRLLGHESCSLAAIVEHYCQVKLEKKEQKSNWKKRPLTKSQLNYAHLDTLYLETLMNAMKADLEAFGLLEEFNQEMKRLESEPLETERALNPDGWLRIPGALQASPDIRARIAGLYKLRDERARKENLAAFRIISNAEIARLSMAKASSVAEIEQAASFNPVLVKKDAERILSILNDSGEIHDDMLPDQKKNDPQTESIFRNLKKWRWKLAEYRGMEASTILSNKMLLEIADKRPDSLDLLAELDLMSEYKLEKYGPSLLQIVNGRMPVELPEVPTLPEDRKKKLTPGKGNS